MTPAERVEIMRVRLIEAFQPQQLEIVDDSHHHVGHAGSRDGAGHYHVRILCEAFLSFSRIQAHRAVYAVLNDLIPQEIHALQITVISSKSA